MSRLLRRRKDGLMKTEMRTLILSPGVFLMACLFFGCSGSTSTLVVTQKGTGSGTVASKPAGIDCGKTCLGGFAKGAAVTLTAAPSPDSTFGGWSGDCAGNETSTSVTLNVDKSCAATFNLLPPMQSSLIISKTGAGEGAVTSDPAGIDCGSACQGNFNHGAIITLTAVPSINSTFGGWSGDCGGMEPSVPITLMEEAHCVAAFNIAGPSLFNLSISKLGSGAITSDPAGIDCGTTCQGVFPGGVPITLKAVPSPDAVFVGWGGDCVGKEITLSLTLAADKSCTGAFTGLFGAAVNLNVGQFPVHVKIVDLNGDGRSDMVTVNEFDDSVSVLLGAGDGSFGPAAKFPVGQGPCSVAVGDFDGDGVPDLATVDSGVATVGNTVSILIGDGKGGFSAATPYIVGMSPRGIVAGDFNKDGVLDLATANWGTNNVSVLIGKGDGSFMPAVDYPVGANPRAIAIGDLNGDGNPDLAIADRNSDSVSILLGAGDGTFAAAQAYAVGSFPRSVAIGDLNGDGKADVVVVNNNSNDVSVLLGAGAGLLGTAINFPVGKGPRGVAIADLNGDGKPDLAVADSTSGTASLLLGDGAGAFGAGIDFAAQITPSSVAIGDLNGDGKPDLAVTNAGSNTISLFLHQ